MLAELAAQEAARREDAGRILESAAQQARAQLADAGAESQRVRAEARQEVAAAQRELEELRALQHQVSEQLTAVRALLDWTLPQMPGRAASTHAPRRCPRRCPAVPAPRNRADPSRNRADNPTTTTRADERVPASAAPGRQRAAPARPNGDRPAPAPVRRASRPPTAALT